MGVRACSDSCFHAEGEDAGRGQGRLNVFNMFLVTNLYLFFKMLYEGAVKYD